MSEERQLGRAKNAILSLLEHRISVPKIYIDAVWAGTHLDVLAIDRDGVGDVHAVLVYPRPFYEEDKLDIVSEPKIIDQLLDRFVSIPAQYKYIAAVDVSRFGIAARFGLAPSLVEKSFSPDGLGRVGFLVIDAAFEEEPKVTIAFKPERFRAAIAKLADEYVKENTPDWEIRA